MLVKNPRKLKKIAILLFWNIGKGKIEKMVRTHQRLVGKFVRVVKVS
jgi:hypothetical protein